MISYKEESRCVTMSRNTFLTQFKYRQRSVGYTWFIMNGKIGDSTKSPVLPFVMNQVYLKLIFC